MGEQGRVELIDLTGEELVAVTGGVIPMAAFVMGAFGAGFRFGYYELGPLLCG